MGWWNRAGTTISRSDEAPTEPEETAEAEASAEPAKCFEEIIRGRVNWGAGTAWATTNALALCGGTRDARRTLDCFTKEIAASQTWQVAIRQCRTR